MSWNLRMEIRWKRTESCLIFRSSFSLLLSCLPSFKVGISPQMLIILKGAQNTLKYNETYIKFLNLHRLGFIIDAFGALRDQLDSVQDELENNCFICGIGKDYLDAIPHGFDIHVEKEHNLANYL